MKCKIKWKSQNITEISSCELSITCGTVLVRLRCTLQQCLKQIFIYLINEAEIQFSKSPITIYKKDLEDVVTQWEHREQLRETCLL